MSSRAETMRTLWLAVGLALATATAALAEPRPVHILTASAGGLYHPIGGAICRLINLDRETNGLRCVAKTSGGSVANANALHEGTAELAIMQSDIAADALAGIGTFAQGAIPELRLLFVAHAEPFVLIARRGSDIRSLADLSGKRIGIGNRGSGQRVAMERILAEMGIEASRSGPAGGLDPAAQNAALCAGTTDAIVMMAGHPNGLVQEAIASCGGTLLPIAGPAIDALLARHPAYARTTVAGGLYPAHPAAIPTFGSHAVIVATAEVPDAVVTAALQAVFGHLADFTRLHPVLARLEPADMAAPIAGLKLHPAAQAFFAGRGLGR